MDISSAFRLLSVCLEDFCMLGFKFINSYYVDNCLPMGCSISCSLFEMFSSFLHWELLQRSNSRRIIYYLDEFSFIGRANTAKSEMLMALFAVLYTLSYNIQVGAIHVLGKNYNIADAIFRFQWSRFRQLAPTADNFLVKSFSIFGELFIKYRSTVRSQYIWKLKFINKASKHFLTSEFKLLFSIWGSHL